MSPEVPQERTELQEVEALLKSDPRQAQKRAEEILRCAREAGNLSTEGYACYLLGRIEGDEYSPEMVEALFERACACARQVGDRLLEGQSLHGLGRLQRNRGNRLEALECLERARVCCQEAGHVAEEAFVLSSIATLYFRIGEVRETIACVNEAVALARQGDDPSFLLFCLNNLGGIEVLLGQHEEGLCHLREVCDLAARLGELKLLALASGNIAYSLVEQGAYTEALQSADEALAQAVSLNLSFPEVTALTVRGRALGALDRPNEAEKSLRRALFLAERVGQVEEQTEIFVHLGQFYQTQQRSGRALFCFTRALKLAQSTGALPWLAQAHRGLSQISEARGEYRQALEHLKAFYRAEQEHRSQQECSYDTAIRTHIENERAQRAAREDALTGLLNRRSLDEYLQNWRTDSREISLLIAFLDIDNFKWINDRFGHSLGDDVLKRVASLVRANCRPQDRIVRYGGEEFVLVFREGDPMRALAISERVRQAIEHEPWHELHPSLNVTVSIGLANGTSKGAESLMHLADQRLYQAKHAGKNRIIFE